MNAIANKRGSSTFVWVSLKAVTAKLKHEALKMGIILQRFKYGCLKNMPMLQLCFREHEAGDRRFPSNPVCLWSQAESDRRLRHAKAPFYHCTMAPTSAYYTEMKELC